MSTPLAYMLQRQFPVMLRHAGEAATYIPASGDETEFTCTVTGRAETQTLDVAWEVSARQIEVYAAADDVPTTYMPRRDVIEVRGDQYTILERTTSQGGIYRYLCERSEIESISHRGRRY